MNDLVHDVAQAITVRRSVASERAAMLALADRLMVGVAPWRDPGACLRAVRAWAEASLVRDSDDGALFVATDAAGRVIGCISVQEHL